MKDYIPTPEELANRELAYNLADDTLSLKVDTGEVKRLFEPEQIENGTKLPDGTFIQWGYADIPSKANDYKTTRISFTNNFYDGGVYVTVAMNTAFPSGAFEGLGITGVSAGGFDATIRRTTDTSSSFYWQAIGRWKA